MFNKLPPKSEVILMGGEPTYHPDFERIVLEKPDHVSISMLTNGAKPLSFWQKISSKLGRVTFTFHPEFANVDRFIENALEVSSRVQKFRAYMMMVPAKWDYCVDVYDKLILAGLKVTPKVVLENFQSNVDPSYTEYQLKWIEEKSEKNEKYIKVYDKNRNLLGKTNATELMSSGQIDFTGFKCYAPMQHIVVTPGQKIFNSRCSQRTSYSSLSDPNFKLPDEPMLCQTKFCKCQADIGTRKTRE
jgi:MoaA/NifB/PqqE/SkfB family radical SAM enzyme